MKNLKKTTSLHITIPHKSKEKSSHRSIVNNHSISALIPGQYMVKTL